MTTAKGIINGQMTDERSLREIKTKMDRPAPRKSASNNSASVSDETGKAQEVRIDDGEELLKK